MALQELLGRLYADFVVQQEAELEQHVFQHEAAEQLHELSTATGSALAELLQRRERLEAASRPEAPRTLAVSEEVPAEAPGGQGGRLAPQYPETRLQDNNEKLWRLWEDQRAEPLGGQGSLSSSRRRRPKAAAQQPPEGSQTQLLAVQAASRMHTPSALTSISLPDHASGVTGCTGDAPRAALVAPEIADSKEDAQLLQAVLKRDTKSALELLQKQHVPRLNALDESGNSLLHQAVLRSMVAAAMGILKRQDFEAVNAKNRWGDTALHVAAEQGLIAVCRAILARADFVELEAVDQRLGKTALERAVAGNRTSVMAFLRKAQTKPKGPRNGS